EKEREVRSLRKADVSWNSGTGLSPHAGYRGVLHTSTTGWQPTCSCDGGDPVPCTVLDPFSGAGTTGLVALARGRDYIGIELNPDYAEMSKRRIVSFSPMFNEVEVNYQRLKPMGFFPEANTASPAALNLKHGLT